MTFCDYMVGLYRPRCSSFVGKDFTDKSEHFSAGNPIWPSLQGRWDPFLALCLDRWSEMQYDQTTMPRKKNTPGHGHISYGHPVLFLKTRTATSRMQVRRSPSTTPATTQSFITVPLCHYQRAIRRLSYAPEAGLQTRLT